MENYILELRKKVGNRPLIIVWSTILVIDDNKKILFQKRSDSLDWGLPWWAMEPWESFEETAKRELFEETNLKCIELSFLKTFSWKELYYKYPNWDESYNVIALFKTNIYEWDLKINDNEWLELKFFSVNELPKLEKRANIIIKEIKNIL